jgi:translation initiation factor IF-1
MISIVLFLLISITWLGGVSNVDAFELGLNPVQLRRPYGLLTIHPRVSRLFAMKKGNNYGRGHSRKPLVRIDATEPQPAVRKIKDDVIEVMGVVVDALPNAAFRVQIEPSKQLVLTTISGKIRKNTVKVLVGDLVTLELSTYDLSKGRITFRHQQPK